MTSDTLPLTLTTKPLVCINCLKKTVYHSSYLATCNKFFSIQDCHTWTFQVEYQGQTEFLNTSLHLIALIFTSYCIQHRLELKYFHFAQFLLNAHQAAHLP